MERNAGIIGSDSPRIILSYIYQIFPIKEHVWFSSTNALTYYSLGGNIPKIYSFLWLSDPSIVTDKVGFVLCYYRQ